MIVEDIVSLANEISDTRERLEYLYDGRDRNAYQDIYSKELDSVEQATDRKSQRLDLYVQELIDLRVNAGSAADGFIDFPAVRECQSVCLCWTLGEQEVMYWHRADEDCAKRRLVDLPLIRQSGERHLSETV
jgi:hypothetical protein